MNPQVPQEPPSADKKTETRVARGGSLWVDNFRLLGHIWRGQYPPPRPDIKPPTVVERVWMSLLVLLRALSLSELRLLVTPVEWLYNLVDAYAIMWLLVLLTLLLLNVSSGLVIALAIYRPIDLTAYGLSVVFVDSRRDNWGLRSVHRSLMLLLVNYCEVVVAYALLHLNFGTIVYSKCGQPVKTGLEALYFSAVTITTLGFGDIVPRDGLGRLLVVAELLNGFLLVAVLLAYVVAGFQPAKTIPRDHQDIRRI